MKQKILLTLIIGMFLISFVSSFGYNTEDGEVGDIEVTTNFYTGNLTNLSQLEDTNVPAPGDGEVLTWSAAASEWIAQAASAITKWIFNVATMGGYFYNSSTTLFFNESFLNDTIDSRADSSYDYNMSIPYDDYNYNMSDGVGTGNLSWNETYADTLYAGVEWDYNQSTPYDDFNYNMSDGSYNASYDGLNTSYNKFWYNQTGIYYYNQSVPYDDFNYNMTVDGSYDYNMTLDSNFDYNMSSPYDTYNYNMSDGGADGSYNLTYANNNKTYFDTLYSAIKWAYNQTIGSLVYLATASDNLQSNISAVNTSLIDRFKDYNYNMTVDGSYDYNMSTPYDNYNYNMTVDGDYDYNMSDGSYNATYNKWAYNETFNESTLSTIYYNATQSTIVAGTINAGALSDTQHSDGGYDGKTFNFSEVAGSPGLDLRINFTGIEDFNRGVIRFKTGSLSGSFPIIQMWNYDDSIWEDYPPVAESLTFATITQPVFDATDHVSGGVAQMRIYKASNGNTNNHYYVDWIAIASGFGTPSGEEIDPYSFHRGENLNNTGYNVTASYLFGNGTFLTGLSNLYAGIKWAYNQTVGSLVYLATASTNLQSNISAVNTSLIDRFKDYNYNMTVDGDYDYNMSSPYDDYNYNQSSPYDTYNYNMSDGVGDTINGTRLTIENITNFDYNYNQSDGSYNLTYANNNKTFFDTIYAAIQWGYNQTVGSLVYLATASDNLQSNISAVNTSLIDRFKDYNYNFTGTGDYYYNQSLPYDDYNYNMTDGSLVYLGIASDNLQANISAVNTSLIDRFKTYNYNQSDGSYNATYDGLNASYYKYWYNQTGIYYYNQSLPYDDYNYNQSSPYDDYNYNMTDGSLVYIGEASDNLQSNISAVNTSLIDRFKDYNYNMTVDGDYDYNMSSPYDDYNYNQSSPYDDYNYNMSHPAGTDFAVGGNLTLGQKITFTLGEIIDNIVNGWIQITGGLRITDYLIIEDSMIGNGTANFTLEELNATGADGSYNVTYDALNSTYGKFWYNQTGIYYYNQSTPYDDYNYNFTGTGDYYYNQSTPYDNYNYNQSSPYDDYNYNMTDGVGVPDYTNIAMVNDTNHFALNQNLTNHNITGIQCMVFQSGGSWCTA